MFLAIATHPLLDIMTVYGTGLFEPFSDARLFLGNISIVDPLYTLPLALPLVVMIFFRTKWNLRPLVLGGFIISHLYLVFTMGNLHYVTDLYRENLHNQNIHYEKLVVAPTFLNNILWYGVAIDGRHGWLGLYSHFDNGRGIRFYRIDRNLSLHEKVSPEELNSLVRFSQGFYCMSENDDGVSFHDLRFGFIRPGTYIFAFNFSEPQDRPFGKSMDGHEFESFVSRIFGSIMAR